MDQPDRSEWQRHGDPRSDELSTAWRQFDINGGTEVDTRIAGMSPSRQWNVRIESLHRDLTDRCSAGGGFYGHERRLR
ncbi:hypothetical protein GOSPT_005_00220 [Gordonia sputi NBRC 100414]|uniref:Uncharacterized protein n=1 Tax=Gordonia sputi NBRC 100414 TaxID=1089453 RepID=H5TUX6_9ACTN|nr:hypothetical protein GOSPT_005_00220 [Gordonia sputi NBRC 100414]